MRPFFWQHLFSLVLVVLSSLMYLLDPLLLKWLIDDVLPRRNGRLLAIAGAAFFLIYTLRLTFSAVASVINSRTVQALICRIRMKMLEHMNLLSADYHETTPVGDRLHRMEQDVDQVAELGSNLVPFALQTLFNSSFVIVTMFVLNARLTCLALPLLPVVLLIRKRFHIPLKQAASQVQTEAGGENSFLLEHLTAILQIQLLTQEKTRSAAFSARVKTRMRAAIRRISIESAFGVSCMMMVAIATVLLIGYGGYQVLAGSLTIGGLVAFYSYLGRLFDPVHAAVAIYSQLSRLRASTNRIVETIELIPSVSESLTPVVLQPDSKAVLVFEDVGFGYSNASFILDRLSFEIPVGQRLALVAASGQGKSTIGKLSVRLYDVCEGAVRVDGVNVRDIQLASLRSTICYLVQEPSLLDLTIRENLLLGCPRAGTKELINALEIAELMEFVQSLPRGLDTGVGPRGALLSGGERQRLALARGILQQSKIIIFDESTSALDLPGERRVLSNLSRHLSDTTMIFISHRLTSLAWVDRVLVLNRGSVQEEGTPQYLAQAGGLYARLCNSPVLAGEKTLAVK